MRSAPPAERSLRRGRWGDAAQMRYAAYIARQSISKSISKDPKAERATSSRTARMHMITAKPRHARWSHQSGLQRLFIVSLSFVAFCEDETASRGSLKCLDVAGSTVPTFPFAGILPCQRQQAWSAGIRLSAIHAAEASGGPGSCGKSSPTACTS